jgi:hypothetical protein
LLILLEISTGALVAVLWVAPVIPAPFEPRTIWLAATGFMAAAVLISFGVLIDGTSFSGLINGAFLSQRNLPKLFILPLNIPTVDLLVAAVGCALAAATVTLAVRSGYERLARYLRSWPAASLRLMAGLWILLSACGPQSFFGVTIAIPTETFVLVIPFLWVAAVSRGDPGEASLGFVRVLLTAIGTLGCLEAYPVAGSQGPWAAALLVPAGVLCMWDGLTLLCAREFRSVQVGALVPLLARMTALAACAALVVGQIVPTWNYFHYLYGVSVPLQVSGGTMIRQYEPTAQAITLTARFLRSHCSTFEGSPGLNSFYFFTGEDPPTGLNTTQWRKLLSANQQATILRKLRTIPRLCVLENSYAAAVWYPPKSEVPPSVLYDYLTRNFVKTATFGDYTIEVRKTNGAGVS